MSDYTYELQTNPNSYVHFKVWIMVLSNRILNNYVIIKIFSFKNYE